jgi:hypothetical protein
VVYRGENRLRCLHSCGICVCFDVDPPHNQRALNDSVDMLCSCKVLRTCQNKDHHIPLIAFGWLVTSCVFVAVT